MTWFVNTQTGRKGPFSVEQIKVFLETGRLQLESIVLTASGERTRVASLVPDVQPPLPPMPVPARAASSQSSKRAPRPAARPAPTTPRARGKPATTAHPTREQPVAPSATPLTWPRALFSKQGLWLVIGPIMLIVLLLVANSEDNVSIRGRHAAKKMFVVALAQALGMGGSIALGVVIIPVGLAIFYFKNRHKIAPRG